MQDSYHPPDIFVLYEKFPLRIESAQFGKQSHVPTWQQGFWKGTDEKKEIPKKNRKTCRREKHLRSALKPTKMMPRGGFCFPPFGGHWAVSLPGGQFPNVASLMKHWESSFGGWKFTVIAAPQVGTLPHLLFDWTEHRVGIPGNETWLAGTWPGRKQRDGCS